MGNPGKAWEILGKHGKSWQGIGNPRKAWKIPGKHGRYQEFRESAGNPSLGSAGKIREMPGFFLDETCSGLISPKGSKIPRKHGKARESMENSGKAW